MGQRNPFASENPRSREPASPDVAGLRPAVDEIVYFYAQHVVNLGVLLVHHAFSFIFAMAYCLGCLRFPRFSLWQGAAFGLVVTVGFHGIVLPLRLSAAAILGALPACTVINGKNTTTFVLNVAKICAYAQAGLNAASTILSIPPGRSGYFSGK